MSNNKEDDQINDLQEEEDSVHKHFISDASVGQSGVSNVKADDQMDNNVINADDDQIDLNMIQDTEDN